MKRFIGFGKFGLKKLKRKLYIHNNGAIMHFVLCISIDESVSRERKSEIMCYIENILSTRYQYAKRLGNFYIIRINSVEDYNNILNDIMCYVRNQIERILFIMSPIMTTGRYNGNLEVGEGGWDFINQITG